MLEEQITSELYLASPSPANSLFQENGGSQRGALQLVWVVLGYAIFLA